MTDGDPMVLLEGVTRTYQMGESTIHALDGVDLTVDPGTFAVILGPSGSGKTTLLNLIGGLDMASSGRVVVAGQDITTAHRAERFAFRRHAVSFIFQTFNLLGGLTAIENVQFGADVAGRPDAAERAHQALTDVGLAGRADHFGHQLSGGEQQRVAIARALATGNPLLLADEPTGELDFTTGVAILRLLRRQADAGLTVMVVTHNREIARVADRVIQVSSGRIVHDGPPEGGVADMAALQW
jgi:putative ABC transport system ATP-binding protein